MKFCTGHMDDIGKAVKRHGYWRYVNPAPDAIRGFTARWLLGRAGKDEIDPLIVLMLELGAKAVRMGLNQNARRCPLCAIAHITKDADAPGKQIAGMMEKVVDPLMVSNGRKPGDGRRVSLIVRPGA